MTTPTIPGEQVEQSPAPLETEVFVPSEVIFEAELYGQKVITSQSLKSQEPRKIPAGLQPVPPWDSVTGSAAGKVGGSRRTQAKRDAAKLRAIKSVAKQVGVQDKHRDFLINFLESGDTARAQIVKTCNEIDDSLSQLPQGLVASSRSRLQEVMLKAAEHQHGRAPIKVHSINLNFDVSVNETDALDVIEAFSQ